MSRQLIAGLVLATALVASACTGEADVVVDTTELPITTDAPITTEPATTVPPTTEPTTTAPAPADSTTEPSDAGSVSTLPGLGGIIDPETLDEFEEAIKTDEGRDRFIDAVVAAVPALTRDQAGCFLDNVDIQVVVSFTGGGVEDLTAQQVGEIVSVLEVCDIAIETLLTAGGTS